MINLFFNQPIFSNALFIAVILKSLDVITTLYALKIGLQEQNKFIIVLHKNIKIALLFGTIIWAIPTFFIYIFALYVGIDLILINLVLAILNIYQLAVVISNINTITKKFKVDKNK